MQYYLKLKSNPDNPTHQVVFEPLYKDEFIEKEKVIPPKFIQNVWQQSWNDPANRNNKLFAIKPGLGEWLPGLRINRREEIILARLRIGHSYITHSYLLKGEEEPQCIPCNAPLTIKHVLSTV